MRRNSLLNSIRTKDTLTENNMPTHSTSSDPCVDFFATVGSARNWDEAQIIKVFSKAINSDPLVALRILFWARDVRQGAGERRVFRVCTKYMDNDSKLSKYLYKNFHLIPEYGRWDDLFTLSDKVVLEFIKCYLEAQDGLLAKWLPRKGEFANKVRKHLKLSPKDYRKLIVNLSKTVEQHMCAKEWKAINYSHVPSVAMNKYRKAFFRNDEKRFKDFIESVTKGEVKIHADTLFPYQLYRAYKRLEDQKSVEAQWAALPNFMEDNKERVLPVCDTSGSMYNNDMYAPPGKISNKLRPIDICVSLGIYISERNEGLFKDAFITFSDRPTVQYLKGSFYNRCQQLEKADWGMNTNLEATLKLILSSAVKNNISENEMPTVLLILSDMQFDECIYKNDNTAIEMVKNMYADAGYTIPKVVFWNINARINKLPVQYDEAGTAIISGCSPSILKSVLDGSILDPKAVMLKTVMSDRYLLITI